MSEGLTWKNSEPEQDDAVAEITRGAFFRGSLLSGAGLALGLTHSARTTLHAYNTERDTASPICPQLHRRLCLQPALPAGRLATDHVEPGHLLGPVVLTCHRPGEPWQTVNTAELTAAQRTTKETDSYGFYGILNWKQNRDSKDSGSKGSHI